MNDEYAGPKNVLEEFLISSVKRGLADKRMDGRGIEDMGSWN